MSTIYSPYPAHEGETALPASASWWRFLLAPNAKGHVGITRTNADAETGTGATWASFEFFDGHDTIIDTGLDRPTAKVRVVGRGTLRYIDVLHDGPPTPSPDWQALTSPGDHRHPDDVFSAAVG